VRTKVTIVVPAYNADRWLRDALNSAVAQTYQAHEIIVVDDASTDDSVKYLREQQFVACAARKLPAWTKR